MSQCIVYTDNDGTIGIIYPNPDAKKSAIDAEGNDVMIPMTIDDVRAKALPETATSYAVIDKSNIPADRTFRNAWSHDLPGGLVKVDIPKAKVLHMNNIRTIRNKLLAASDTDLLRAQEKNDTAAIDQLKAFRQALRDIPQTYSLTNFNTPEALKNAWPGQLLNDRLY